MRFDGSLIRSTKPIDQFLIPKPIDNFRIEILTMEINAKLGALAVIFSGGRGATGGDLQRNRGGE